MRLKKKLNIAFPKLRVSFLTLPENIEEIDAFKKQWESVVDGVAFQSSVLKPGSQRNDQSLYNTGHRTSLCPNPFRQLVVRADKTILPCCSFWGCELPLGKYDKDATLTAFFGSEKISSIRDSFASNNISLLPQACQNCLSSLDPWDDI